ncbi:TPA: hypothetical protein R4320_001875 [Pasteurella multocida]|uniref:hypothetical protein n=1 Tax=Pasteurella multocida TaxID=747 RepID=UPI00240D8B25|nr:hypothetical protein [Pasteurella multocida]MDG2542080.1 hypothetical protein [Pasteurella multocida]HDR1927878.1 hypothetical protein [Pasteurella multocida]HED4412895.1 hypothetical protein [Pasteurella multocida]HED4456877.1 hypothetical protein [Pasteurella multocida]
MIFSKDFYSIQESCKLLGKIFNTTFKEKDIIDFYLSEYIRLIIQVKDLNEESIIFYDSKKDISSTIKDNYFRDITETYFSITGDKRNILYVLPYQHAGSGYFYLYRESVSISNDFIVVRAIKVLSEKILDINPLVSIEQSGEEIEKTLDIRKTKNGVIVYFNEELLITRDKILISEYDILNLIEVIKEKQSKFNNYIHREYSDQSYKNEANLAEEIKELKSKLEEKDKTIIKLQAALDNKEIPILLGAYRENDPLKIAIEVRNEYWKSYPDNVKSNTQIRKSIVKKYGITQTLATEIEKIACPIDRKKN